MNFLSIVNWKWCAYAGGEVINETWMSKEIGEIWYLEWKMGRAEERVEIEEKRLRLWSWEMRKTMLLEMFYKGTPYTLHTRVNRSTCENVSHVLWWSVGDFWMRLSPVFTRIYVWSNYGFFFCFIICVILLIFLSFRTFLAAPSFRT